MNNSNDATNLPGASEAFIEELYDNYVFDLVLFSTTTMLLYSTILKIFQEIELMWLKRISLPTILYALARYATLLNVALLLVINLLPMTVPLKTCNIIDDLTNAISILSHIGVQGLLIARTYPLVRGNKLVIATLSFGFLSSVILNIFNIVAFNGCLAGASSSPEKKLIILLGNIFIIITDLLMFGVSLHKVWDTWHLKRNTDIHKKDDLISVLFEQIVSRFFFVVFITLTITIVEQFISTVAVAAIANVQSSLSGILVADFTLDLRQSNTSTIQTNDLPVIRSIRDLGQHIHQSFLVELDHNLNSEIQSLDDMDDPVSVIQDGAEVPA